MGAARQAAIDALKADSSVTEVAQVAEDGGIWAAFDDGVLGALNLAVEGTRGGAGEGGGEAADGGGTGAIESGLLAGKIPVLTKDTLLLSPFISEFGSDDEVQLIGGVASQLSCPAFFSVKGPYNNQAAGLSQFRKMSRHGIVAVATHGEAYFKGLSTDAKQRMGWSHMGSHEVLWTGEPVNCTAMTKKTVECQTSAQCPAGTECIITHASFSAGTSQAFGVCHDATQVDLMSGRVVMGDRTYGVAPAFVLKHGIEDRYPQSLIYLGACKSLWNMTLATAFFAAGAKTVAGYSGVVSNPYATKTGGEFIVNMMENKMDVGEAYGIGSQDPDHPGSNPYATKTGGEFIVNMMENKMDVGEAYGIGSQDPDHPGSFFRFFGARHLTISEPGILNQSWETGDLTAWAREGDGRVVTKLCTARPAGGKFMSIISTGLGFTTQTGSIEQTFCIPEGTNSFSFFWKFYSEEFNEWCCSQFQDTFKATFTDEKSGKEYKIVDLAVDDLCKSDCFGACSSFGCSLGKHYVGLSASECDFDQGDAWKTDWQKASFDISKTGLAGNVPVRLRFFATDKGDSVYDTAILVDAIKFE
ncbi:MAG: hypothetical protein FJ087_18070 [Deltaproteobacteria bacterium]|nr:hypothetical protein [Deltaproteobacteria bacterium]